MGQVLSSDQSNQLNLQPPSLNVKETKKYTALFLSQGVQSQFFEKVFQYQNYKKIQVTYRFLPDVYIHLQLTKQKSRQEAGHILQLGCETVYGYKFKKNQKSEKIRSDKIYFRRKIFIPTHQPTAVKPAIRQKMKSLKSLQESRKKSISKETGQKNYLAYKEDLLRKLAQLKLLSKMDLGIKIGRTIDGNDGILTEHYIEFYSEVAISQINFADRQAGQKDKICETLKKKGFKVNDQNIDIAYSVFQKGYILRQCKKAPRQVEQNQTRSIKFMVREFEDEINKAIVKLDGISNMMTAIQNYLSQRDIQKAMQKFEESMSSMQEGDRLIYAQQMALILGKYNYYKSYERQVSSYVSSSRSSSMAESRNLSVSRFNPRSLKSEHPQDSTDNQALGRLSSNQEVDLRINGSPVSSPRSNHPLRFSESQTSNKLFINSFQQDFSLNDGGNKLIESNFIMWESAQQRLKNSILDNDKNGINQALTCLKNLGILNPLEVQIYFGQLLMENAKTKHAKFIFQKLLHNKKGGYYEFLKSQIYSMLGFLAHSKESALQALTYYQKSLTLRFKFRNYSRKTVLIFNNMSVLCYYLQKYEKCLLYLHRGMKLGQYCPDYELLMRSNYAMCLAGQGQLKQAKLQMYKTYRNVEPYSNNEIVCKFYSNLGYFDLLDNVLDKAKASLQLACQIQQKFLITNGFKPSVFLHNNYAMYYYKKSEWRKAASHLQKIQNQLNELHGFKSIQIHFNFGKIYRQLYNYDTAIKHFLQSRYLLLKLDQKLVVKYRSKIEQEIQRIQCNRIDEVSEESEYFNKLSKISKSMMSQKHIESRIKN